MSLPIPTIVSASPGPSAAEHARRTDANARAADAAGIGRTDAEEQTSDRDADGRRLLERQTRQIAPTEITPDATSEPTRLSRDATGHAGTQLDLTG